jgi:hypothetical protein
MASFIGVALEGIERADDSAVPAQRVSSIVHRVDLVRWHYDSYYVLRHMGIPERAYPSLSSKVLFSSSVLIGLEA